jgi:hypothetical protein
MEQSNTPKEWLLEPLTPEELAARCAIEGSTPAQRLAALEAADPSQKRPPRRPSVMDRVDFIAEE